MNKIGYFRYLISIALLLVLAATGALIPVTGAQAAAHSDEITTSLPALEEFIQQVMVVGSTQVTGIYAPDLFAIKVIQQPAGNPGFVSTSPDEITQFNMAAQYGVTGLLAHNHLAGAAFSNLQTGSVVYLVHGDSSLTYYQITEIHRYQATSPTSPYSNFVDLDDPDHVVITSTTLFNEVYTQSGRLVLQTCIANGAELSWGRLFILAEPITQMELLSNPQPVDWGVPASSS
ncbi:MAG: hypothetical protein HPY76_05035 [Anaerolineae bacterium]|jgi:hypothetical protein|nr:hypothetical protein [Anaerolineae bacterium]